MENSWDGIDEIKIWRPHVTLNACFRDYSVHYGWSQISKLDFVLRSYFNCMEISPVIFQLRDVENASDMLLGVSKDCRCPRLLMNRILSSESIFEKEKLFWLWQINSWKIWCSFSQWILNNVQKSNRDLSCLKWASMHPQSSTAPFYIS